MSVLDNLATAQGRRDDVPNKKLAEAIAQSKNTDAIKELVLNLDHNDKGIQSYCIKVLYEIGERSPQLISQYHKEFLALLNNKNNRMIWGAMTALDTITLTNSDGVASGLDRIVNALKKGSVITIDRGVSILAKLASVNVDYLKKIFPVLLNQLKLCPPKQLAQYAEKTIIAVTDQNRNELIRTIESRKADLTNDSQRKRIQSVLNKIKKMKVD